MSARKAKASRLCAPPHHDRCHDRGQEQYGAYGEVGKVPLLGIFLSVMLGTTCMPIASNMRASPRDVKVIGSGTQER